MKINLILLSSFQILLALCLTVTVSAQDQISIIDKAIQVWSENTIENNDDRSHNEQDIYEELNELLRRPIDLNQANRNELQRLHFLTATDINAILSHRKNFGHLNDRWELSAIKGLDQNKAQILTHFIYINEKSLRQKFQRYNTRIIVKSKSRIESEAGYHDDIRESLSYSGSRQYLLTRLTHYTSKDWRIGIAIEKDAGEIQVNDFTGAYIDIPVSKKYLDRVIIGDHHVNLGEGLISHTSYRSGKSAIIGGIKNSTPLVSPYSSLIENGMYRGIATVWSWHSNIKSLLSFSSKHIDGNKIFNDSGEYSHVSSFQNSGLHRTAAEIADKDALLQQSVTWQMGYSTDAINVSTHGQHHHLSKPYTASNQLYNQYRWSGTDLTLVGIAYDIHIASSTIYGEYAYSSPGGHAIITGMLSSLHPRLDIGILYRNISRDYYSLSSNAFIENSTVTNENGIFLLLQYQINDYWRLNTFVDTWKHPWLRFGVDAPSSGREYLLRLEKKVKNKYSYYIQYRYKHRVKNSQESRIIDIITNNELHRLRVNSAIYFNDQFEMRSRVEGSMFDSDYQYSTGWALYNEIIYNHPAGRLKSSARINYFDTPEYDNRIYAYERDVQNEYSLTLLYGKGWRYYLNIKYKLNRFLKAEVKWAQTIYTDGRTTVGNASTLTNGNKHSIAKLQLIWTM